MRLVKTLFVSFLLAMSMPQSVWAQIDDGEAPREPAANETPDQTATPLQKFLGLGGIFLSIDLTDRDEDEDKTAAEPNVVTLDQPGTVSQTWIKRQRRAMTKAEAKPARAPYLASMVERRGGSRVPVIAPYAMTMDEAAADYHQLRMRITRNGYTLLVHEPGLDIVITGSRTYFRRDQGGSADLPHEDYRHDFEAFDDGGGGSISFGRNEADYHVEFYCLGLREPEQENCIDKLRAEDFVTSMLEEG